MEFVKFGRSGLTVSRLCLGTGVKIGFYGSGALPESMSDFNDVAFIHRVGLSHSITTVTREAEAATPNLPGPTQRARQRPSGL